MSDSFEKISQSILLEYPSSDFQYVLVYFAELSEGIVPIEKKERDNYKKVHSCYFICRKMKWFERHEISRMSYCFSVFKLKDEFSPFLYREKVIDYVIEAMINEEGEVIELDEELKRRIDPNVLYFVADKISNSRERSKILELDYNSLGRDVHKYLQYQILPDDKKNKAFRPPSPPAVLVLSHLLEAFPTETIDSILDIDNNLIEQISIVNKQKEVAEFEKFEHKKDLPTEYRAGNLKKLSTKYKKSAGDGDYIVPGKTKNKE